MEQESKQNKEAAWYNPTTDQWYLGDIPFDEPLTIEDWMGPTPQSVTPPDEEDYEELRSWLKEEKPNEDDYMCFVNDTIATRKWLDARMDRGLLILGRSVALKYFGKAKDLYYEATGIQIEDELDLINFC